MRGVRGIRRIQGLGRHSGINRASYYKLDVPCTFSCRTNCQRSCGIAHGAYGGTVTWGFYSSLLWYDSAFGPKLLRQDPGRFHAYFHSTSTYAAGTSSLSL